MGVVIFLKSLLWLLPPFVVLRMKIRSLDRAVAALRCRALPEGTVLVCTVLAILNFTSS